MALWFCLCSLIKSDVYERRRFVKQCKVQILEESIKYKANGYTLSLTRNATTIFYLAYPALLAGLEWSLQSKMSIARVSAGFHFYVHRVVHSSVIPLGFVDLKLYVSYHRLHSGRPALCDHLCCHCSNSVQSQCSRLVTYSHPFAHNLCRTCSAIPLKYFQIPWHIATPYTSILCRIYLLWCSQQQPKILCRKIINGSTRPASSSKAQVRPFLVFVFKRQEEVLLLAYLFLHCFLLSEQFLP